MPPSNWQFSWMAPFYDYFLLHRSHEVLDSIVQLDPGDHVLDAGGGTGELCDHLSVPDNVRYVSADINQSMLKQGHSRSVFPVRCDVDRLPFRDTTFDVVLFLDSLHHMGTPREVMPEVKRCAGDETLVVFEEFDPSAVLGRVLFWGERLMGMGSQFLTPEELNREMERLGFVREELRLDGFVYYSTFRPRH